MTRAPLVHRNLSASNRQARELYRMLGQPGGLTVDVPYQRESVWTDEQRQNLVKSWLLGIAIPAIIANRRDTSYWTKASGWVSPTEPWTAVIDGKQRLLTAKAWFEGDFGVPAWWFPEEYLPEDVRTVAALYESNGKEYLVRYPWLTEAGQRLFSNRALLPYAEASLASVEEEAEVYLLVNSAGTAQTEADLARAAAVAEGRETRMYGLAAGDQVEVTYTNMLSSEHEQRVFRAVVNEVVLVGQGGGLMSPNRNVRVTGLYGGPSGWYAHGAVRRVARGEG